MQEERARMLTLKIYCDTSVLPENIDGTDPKSQRESAAMKKLQTYHGLMFGSHIVRYEAANTPNESKRNQLLNQSETLKRVPKDEKPVGFNETTGPNAAFVGFFLIADVQDESIRKELIARGLEQRDAEHLTQAVCNDCDAFLTRDEKSIIKPHRAWLQQRFPKLKVWLPSELLASIESQRGPTGDAQNAHQR
jgi:predicted nucleic acid-binding protein